MTVLIWTLAIVLVLVGVIGIIVPALPGTILIFAGLLLAAWSDGFMRVSVWTIAVIGVIGAASYAIDFVAVALGAKHLGGSRRAMAGAAFGTLLGLFFGLPGVLVGPFVGAMLGELSAHRDWRRAGRAGLAAWIGFAIGTAAKVGMAFAMVGIFVTAFLL